jgi:hypothetical protein
VAGFGRFWPPRGRRIAGFGRFWPVFGQSAKSQAQSVRGTERECEWPEMAGFAGFCRFLPVLADPKG